MRAFSGSHGELCGGRGAVIHEGRMQGHPSLRRAAQGREHPRAFTRYAIVVAAFRGTGASVVCAHDEENYNKK